VTPALPIARQIAAVKPLLMRTMSVLHRMSRLPDGLCAARQAARDSFSARKEARQNCRQQDTRTPRKTAMPPKAAGLSAGWKMGRVTN
jgi:hypothetical protein